MFDLAELDTLEAGLAEIEMSRRVAVKNSDRLIRDANLAANWAETLRASSRQLRSSTEPLSSNLRAATE